MGIAMNAQHKTGWTHGTMGLGVCTGVAVLLALAAPVAARAEEMHALAADALRDTLPALAKSFTQATGVRVTIEYGEPEALAARIEAGADVDVMILTPELLHRVDDRGRMRYGTRTDLVIVAGRAGTKYSGALGWNPAHKTSGYDFLRWLTAPAGADAFRAAGFVVP
jgi:Bacterial extracellular solute-binding protein